MAKTARLKVSQNASLAAAYARLGGAGASAKGKKNKKPLPDLLALGDGYVGAAVAQELVRPLPPLRVGGVVGRSDGDAAAAILGSSKWAAVTRRQRGTGLAGAGSAELYAWPYRFGCALIAYRKDKLRRMGLPGGRPPSTWADLLSPSLRGRVAFPGAPRELCAYALAAAADAEGRSPGVSTASPLHTRATPRVRALTSWRDPRGLAPFPCALTHRAASRARARTLQAIRNGSARRSSLLHWAPCVGLRCASTAGAI